MVSWVSGAFYDRRMQSHDRRMQSHDPLRRPIERRVFPAWSIAIPPSFSETYVADEGYWHAWNVDHSVSLSSFAVDDERGRIPAAQILRQLPPLDGTPVDVLPRGLLGRAVEADAVPPAKASRTLSGMLAADGRALLVTITSDDMEWARRTWRSIRHVPLPRGS
jgi:hypothetical protein